MEVYPRVKRFLVETCWPMCVWLVQTALIMVGLDIAVAWVIVVGLSRLEPWRGMDDRTFQQWKDQTERDVIVVVFILWVSYSGFRASRPSNQRDRQPRPNLPVPELPVPNVPVPNTPVPNVPVPNLPVLNLPALNLPALNLPALNLPAPDLPKHGLPEPSLPEPSLRNAMNTFSNSDIMRPRNSLEETTETINGSKRGKAVIHRGPQSQTFSEAGVQEISRPMLVTRGEASNRRALKAGPAHYPPSTAIRALQTSSRAPSLELPDFGPNWYQSNINRPIEINQHIYQNQYFYAPESMPRDVQAFPAHRIPPRSTAQLLHQAEIEDPSTGLARDSPTRSYRTVRTGEIGLVQDTPSLSGSQRSSADKPDSPIRDWIRGVESLLPHERKAYKESLLKEALTWEKLKVPVPSEWRLRSLIRLDDMDDDDQDGVHKPWRSEDLSRDWENYERHARKGKARDVTQDFSVYRNPELRQLDVLKVWVNCNLHSYQTWPPGYEPRYPNLDMDDFAPSVFTSETSVRDEGESSDDA